MVNKADMSGGDLHQLLSTPPSTTAVIKEMERDIREEVRQSWLRRFEPLRILEAMEDADKNVPPTNDPEKSQDLQRDQGPEIIDLSDEEVVVAKPSKPSGKIFKKDGSKLVPAAPAKPNAQPSTQDVIELNSDDDLVILEAPPVLTKKRKQNLSPIVPVKNKTRAIRFAGVSPPKQAAPPVRPPFQPIHNKSYDSKALPHSVTLSHILGSPEITHSYLFSFQFDLQYILEQYTAHDADIVVLYQTGTLMDSPTRLERQVSLLEVQMPPYTSHHPKLIINIHKNNTMKIWLISCNLTQSEFEINNQMYWASPPLPINTANAPNTKFQKHLVEYLEGYKKSTVPKFKEIMDAAAKYDFSSIKGDFISSVPGSTDKYGYLSLFNSLSEQGLIPTETSKERQLLYQSSSIGAPFRTKGDEVSNIFTHLIAPMVLGHCGTTPSPKNVTIENGANAIRELEDKCNAKLFIVFPSESDIAGSKFGTDSGGWSHFNPYSRYGALQYGMLKPYFHHTHTRQRGTNTSHTKFLIMSSDNFKTLDWVLFTAHNMSKQAWGTIPKRGGVGFQIPIQNFESGVLVTKNDYEGKTLVPLEIGDMRTVNDGEVPIYLPFKVPPRRYGPDDQPWCLQKHQSKRNG